MKIKKYPFPNEYQPSLGVSLKKEKDFRAESCILAERKNGCLSVIPARTRSVVNVGHLFGARTVPPSFVDHGPKLRVLVLAIVDWPAMANNDIC